MKEDDLQNDTIEVEDLALNDDQQGEVKGGGTNAEGALLNLAGNSTYGGTTVATGATLQVQGGIHLVDEDLL